MDINDMVMNISSKAQNIRNRRNLSLSILLFQISKPEEPVNVGIDGL